MSQNSFCPLRAAKPSTNGQVGQRGKDPLRTERTRMTDRVKPQLQHMQEAAARLLPEKEVMSMQRQSAGSAVETAQLQWSKMSAAV